MGVTTYSKLQEVKTPDEVLDTYFRRQVKGAGIIAFTGLTKKQVKQKVEQDTGLQFDEDEVQSLLERVVEEYPMIEWAYLDRRGKPKVLTLDESFNK
jgi:GTP1/Obg family GTP-binding protein